MEESLSNSPMEPREENTPKKLFIVYLPLIISINNFKHQKKSSNNPEYLVVREIHGIKHGYDLKHLTSGNYYF